MAGGANEQLRDGLIGVRRVTGLSAQAWELTDDLLTLARIDADRLKLRKEPVRLDLLVDVVVRSGKVIVADHGPGVADPEAVFDRFHSRSGSAGHGLGLPLARWITRAHGGDLVVNERTGGGAEFALTLTDR